MQIAGNMKYFIVTLVLAVVYAHEEDFVITVSNLNEIAEHVNKNPSSTWQATKFHPSISDKALNKMFRTGVPIGAKPPNVADDADERANYCENNGLPTHFDARERWPECASVIGHIYDQGNCGSCWAVSSASVFSDRVCIATKGKIHALFSGQQILSCCHRCTGKDGCKGGWPEGAFAYIKRSGLTTGGDYKSKQGCQPYLHQHCEHHINGSYPTCSTLKDEKAAKCKLHCYNHRHDKTFKQDRVKASKYYQVSPCAAMNEIYRNGPISAAFTVYEDFFTYKSGVYQYTKGKFAGRHAVKIIGWGEEKGLPYWLVANSWNSHWGDEGYFKIRRANNEVWIENDLLAVTPKIK